VTDEPDTTDAEKRAKFLASLGIEYKATFIPQSMSRNAKASAKSLNWRVWLARNRVTIETDYMQGIGHVPGYNDPGTNQHLRNPLADEKWRNAQTNASETGRYPTTRNSLPLAPLPAPKLEDVLYSLLMDASAYRMTFDEWCDEYGYDTDSRKDHAMYMQCSEAGLKLTRLVGSNHALQKLEELFQNY
jgi:hypothetical protein